MFGKMDPLLPGGTDPFRVDHDVVKQDIEIFRHLTPWAGAKAHFAITAHRGGGWFRCRRASGIALSRPFVLSAT